MWGRLNHQQQVAIEWKYLGYSYAQIAKRLGDNMSPETVRNWFRAGGTLQAIYNDWARSLNKERDEHLRKLLAISDEEWLTVTTNLVRMYAKWNLQERKVPLLNKSGEMVLNKDGTPVMVDFVPNIRFADVIRAFQLQRTLQNKPYTYDPRNAAPEDDEKVQRVIKELNLTAVDFTDENDYATYKRIDEYLEKQ